MQSEMFRRDSTPGQQAFSGSKPGAGRAYPRFPLRKANAKHSPQAVQKPDGGGAIQVVAFKNALDQFSLSQHFGSERAGQKAAALPRRDKAPIQLHRDIAARELRDLAAFVEKKGVEYARNLGSVRFVD